MEYLFKYASLVQRYIQTGVRNITWHWPMTILVDVYFAFWIRVKRSTV